MTPTSGKLAVALVGCGGMGRRHIRGMGRLHQAGQMPGRKWTRGDRVELQIPLPIERVHAHPNVRPNAGRVALQRGPIVYCVEWPDNPQGQVRNLMLAEGAKLTAEFKPGLRIAVN